MKIAGVLGVMYFPSAVELTLLIVFIAFILIPFIPAIIAYQIASVDAHANSSLGKNKWKILSAVIVFIVSAAIMQGIFQSW